VKIVLDSGRCQGHGRCYSLAPEVFGCDDVGQAVLLMSDELTVEQVPLAKLAADNCPEYAIEVS